MCNIWQVTFPTDNTLSDGYLGTTPDSSTGNMGLRCSTGNMGFRCAANE